MLKPVIGRKALLLIDENGEKIVIAADLHIGFELELRERGIRVPFQTKKLLKQLGKILQEVKADRLIVLGDVKHSVIGLPAEEREEVVKFLDFISKFIAKIDIIPGNHDGLLDEILSGTGISLHTSKGIVVRDSLGRSIGLVHGHAWPKPELFACDYLVVAHIHPSIEFTDEFSFRYVEPVWIRVDADIEALLRRFLKYHFKRKIEDESAVKVFTETFSIEPKLRQIIIMPAFNDFLTGQPVNRVSIEESISPILNANADKMENAEVYLIDGTYLGKLSLLMPI